VIPKECKRLAEVDFPIAVVSKHSAREKLIRHGHPSTLHLWWARRPLASCRAILLALLLPDPCDPRCPVDFKNKAREILRPVPGRIGTSDKDLREALLRFIGDFADWEHAANSTFLETGRRLVNAAHSEETPLVVDPFAGGGSIPLEALRLGCDVFASDLNPVACLILKTVLEDIPRHGAQLVGELHHVGSKIKASAEKQLSHLYPNDQDGTRPIAYIWARTVRCEAPNCGAEIPLIRSFWLCNKSSRKRTLRYRVVRIPGKTPEIEFEVFEPKSEKDVPDRTVTRARARCVACDAVLSPDRVRAQLAEQRGGADVIFGTDGHRIGGARMLAIAGLRSGDAGRHYRVANTRDYEAVKIAQLSIRQILDEWEDTGRQGACPFPDEVVKRVPVPFGVINVWLYGMLRWSDLFTARQKIAITTLAAATAALSRPEDEAAQRLTAISVDKTADLGNALARWKPDAECPVNLFARQAIGMTWDFAEAVATCEASGSFLSAYERTIAALESVIGSLASGGQVQPADAAQHPLPDQAAAVWFTDPPYYDSVPYSYISDFFYVWLKRSLGMSTPSLFSGTLTPKAQEIVAYVEEKESADSAYEAYERRMSRAFAEGYRVLRQDGVSSVVFAHKTTEGWEALLSGLISGGWTITGSWPIATEMGTRLRARDSAVLGTSVHLICRPRPSDALIGDWTDVLRELPPRVGEWMQRLQGEGVRGADLVFACIGPALEVFSRYSRVETADGREVPLGGDPEARDPAKRGYLAYVWEVVGRAALKEVLGTAEAQARNGGAGALEEDARLTALFLWTIKSTASDDGAVNGEADEDADIDHNDEEAVGRQKDTKGFSLVYDIVRRFAQPLGIHLDDWEGRVIEIDKGIVRLLHVVERAGQLFGKEGAAGLAARIERSPDTAPQLELFPESTTPKVKGKSKRRQTAAAEPKEPIQATTLDRVHAAMLLQANGRASALRTMLMTEQERSPDFLRLANALSALYPQGCEEKRLLDAMLLALPR
jgi:adenine-specific DNA methylase